MVGRLADGPLCSNGNGEYHSVRVEDLTMG
jgi:hypothetical protein